MVGWRLSCSRLPPCLLLSNDPTAWQALTIFHNQHKMSPASTTNQLVHVRRGYERLLSRFSVCGSDYTNDEFVDEHTGTTFCVTRRLVPTRARRGTVVYLPGNNDYFYQRRFGDTLAAAGYSLLAISFPNHGFASNVDHPYFSTFTDTVVPFSCLDAVRTHYATGPLHALVGHSTGALLAALYAHARPGVVHRLVMHSPFVAWNLNPALHWLLHRIVSPVAHLLPTTNIQFATGSPNTASMLEWNRAPFNPSFKHLLVPPVYSHWVRTVDEGHGSIPGLSIDCPVYVFSAAASYAPGTWDTQSDIVLNHRDMLLQCIQLASDRVSVHQVPGAGHTLEMADLAILHWLEDPTSRQ